MGLTKQYNLTSQISLGNTLFTLPEQYEAGTPQLILDDNVLLLGTDYTELLLTYQFQLAVAPTVGQKLNCYYQTKYTFMSGIAGFTVADLKSNYLFGLDLTDRAGNPIPDSTFQKKIDVALAYFQRDFDIFVVPTVVKSTAILGNSVMLPEPIPYDVLEDPYDYDVHDYMNWGYLRLRKKPVISVERMRLIYPTGQEIIAYPPDWIKVYHKFGQVQIVPMAGSFKQYPLIGQGSMYLPLLSGFLTKNVPSLIHVDYTVGFKQGAIPADFADVVYKKSAIEVLRLAGNAMLPGVASISTGADGLSENTQTAQSGNATMFQAYINEYKKDIDDFINDFRETNIGVKFVVS